jgi:membrane-bound metal-dependent hydrolase YbcI (DUF457 family)
LDVIYNTLWRGFFDHSILWPHSLFPHLAVGLVWWLLRRVGRWPYGQTLAGLAAIGGLSHLALDVFVHGTPLLYPFSMQMFDVVATRVVQGDIRAYVTAPIFLCEPLALTLVALHWTLDRNLKPRVRAFVLTATLGGFAVFAGTFLLFLT